MSIKRRPQRGMRDGLYETNVNKDKNERGKSSVELQSKLKEINLAKHQLKFAKTVALGLLQKKKG